MRDQAGCERRAGFRTALQHAPRFPASAARPAPHDSAAAVEHAGQTNGSKVHVTGLQKTSQPAALAMQLKGCSRRVSQQSSTLHPRGYPRRSMAGG